MTHEPNAMPWGTRRKPPRDRHGTTRKLPFGKSAIYVTVNRWDDGNRGICEIWAKADDGLQGQADGICEAWSLALQHGCPVASLVSHLYGHRDDPTGTAGQPKGLRDALALALAAEAGIEVARHVPREVVENSGRTAETKGEQR